jgi:hypothetical protein
VIHEQRFHRLLLSRKTFAVPVPDQMLNLFGSKVKTPNNTLKQTNDIIPLSENKPWLLQLNETKGYLLHQIIWHVLFHASSTHQNTEKHSLAHIYIPSNCESVNPQRITLINSKCTQQHSMMQMHKQKSLFQNTYISILCSSNACIKHAQAVNSHIT